MIRILKQVGTAIQRRLRQEPNKYKLSLFQKIYFRFRRDNGLNQENILGGIIRYNCAPYWFKHSYQEIFEQGTYKFAEPSLKSFLIVDCGSNIGLSILYYKFYYPNARIIGIEPDPNIFSLLDANLRQYNFQDISLLNKAAWVNNNSIEFESKGGMGGAIAAERQVANTIKIQSVRLKDLLDQPVDFLKIDIEGAEIEVLNDCSSLLVNVKSMFVEYHCYKGQKQLLNDLLSLVTSAGFRYYIRQAYENMDYPFIQKTGAFMDMQLNIFCFRNTE
jgi:FkbM family methyltransferase